MNRFRILEGKAQYRSHVCGLPFESDISGLVVEYTSPYQNDPLARALHEFSETGNSPHVHYEDGKLRFFVKTHDSVEGDTWASGLAEVCQ